MSKVDVEKFESVFRLFDKDRSESNAAQLDTQAVAAAAIIGAKLMSGLWRVIGNWPADEADPGARAVMLGNYWVRNLKAWNDAENRELERKAIADAVEGSGGLFALSALLREHIDRPKRKTADGLAPGADFAVGEPKWVARLEAKIDLLVKQLPTVKF